MASIAVCTDILACLRERTAPATAAEIATATERGRSTVTQALRGLEADGLTTRTRGEREAGKRLPDLWNFATTDNDTEATGEAPTSADTDNDTRAAVTESPALPEAPSAADAPDTPEAAVAPVPTADEVPGPRRAEAGDTAATSQEALEKKGAAASDARPGAREQTNKVSRTTRLEPGGLRQIIKAILESEPEEEFSPTEISHLLRGRSVGAIQNALARLVKDGEAELTCEAPRRYSAA